jgi:hypothetical protein
MRRLLLAASLLAAPAYAYDLRELSIRHQGPDYRVSLDAELAAPAAAVYARLADFAALSALNPSLQVQALSPAAADGRQHLLSQAEFCVLGLCRLLRHSQQLRSLKSGQGGSIVAVTEPPPASDFQSGESDWTVSELGEGRSRLRFESRLRPDFWLAPVVGPWMLERRLREETLITVQRLESQAQERVP